VAEAIGLTVDLLHHSLDVATLGDGVPVSPVGARHVVVLVQVGAYPGGDSLLSGVQVHEARDLARCELYMQPLLELPDRADRKSTRLNSSHANISYAVFCLKKNNNINRLLQMRIDEIFGELHGLG